MYRKHTEIVSFIISDMCCFLIAILRWKNPFDAVTNVPDCKGVRTLVALLCSISE